MQFTKAVSLFALFFLGLVGFVAAGPVQRDVDSSVLAVVNTLQSSVASPLSNIGELCPVHLNHSRVLTRCM
jgi:hypothetical protein